MPLCNRVSCIGSSPLRLKGAILVCNDCYDILEARVLGLQLPLSPGDLLKRQNNGDMHGYKNDYIRMLTILSSEALTSQKFKKLNALIAGMSAEKGLSYTLKYFESLCWFPQTDVIPIGILPANEFYAMIERGMMWKDVGAGLNHGIYAHRLQWHVLMAWVTNDFTLARASGWDHGAYDLFCSMGENEAKDLNLWGRLFDASGTPNCTSPNEVEYAAKKGGELLKGKLVEKAAPFRDTFIKILNAAHKSIPKDTPVDQKNSVFNSNIERLWEPYYLHMRGIQTMQDVDLNAWQEEVGETVNILNYLASNRWAPGEIVMEHNGRIMRRLSQPEPDPQEVKLRRWQSSDTLDTTDMMAIIDAYEKTKQSSKGLPQ
ncbi:LirA/MavJ family T4SS effector [Terriglobus sp. RCC_193]|uniref:LirA/MavJ family T4SS effector n=1 Tax=Terriglobus sp. RCC_193 TaxID=3239218 RepID=UPI003524741C